MELSAAHFVAEAILGSGGVSLKVLTNGKQNPLKSKFISNAQNVTEIKTFPDI